jgi:hypothetical protein
MLVVTADYLEIGSNTQHHTPQEVDRLVGCLQ